MIFFSLQFRNFIYIFTKKCKKKNCLLSKVKELKYTAIFLFENMLVFFKTFLVIFNVFVLYFNFIKVLSRNYSIICKRKLTLVKYRQSYFLKPAFISSYNVY